MSRGEALPERLDERGISPESEPETLSDEDE
jgi:hypothetical protein